VTARRDLAGEILVEEARLNDLARRRDVATGPTPRLPPRDDTLLLAMPIAWKGTVVQYAGRLHRAFPGKRDALIYDYGDAELLVLRRMFAKRLRAYQSLGYEVSVSSADKSSAVAVKSS
jgi:hypothetical protein